MSPVHTGRTFDCTVCGSKYSRAEYLRRHARKHENVYPFKCPFPNCTKAFARSDVLLRHRRRQHPGDTSIRPVPLTRSTSGSPPASPVRIRTNRTRRRLATPDYSPSLDEPMTDTLDAGQEQEDEKPVLLHDSPIMMKPQPHLSIETLQASHLPIVPPFQLSAAAYPPASPTYGSPPGSGGLNDAFRHLLMHDAASYLVSGAGGVPYLSPTLDHRSPWGMPSHHQLQQDLSFSSDESYHSPGSDHGYDLQYPMTPDSADSVTFPIPPYSISSGGTTAIQTPTFARPLADLQRMLRLKLNQ